MIIEPGMKLQNRYEILNELGRGGMGSVFKAHDPLLDRIVAIKTLSAVLSADNSFIQRFQHEARAIAKLNHPGIVGIFDVGQDKGVSFIVMEFISGGSLADLLKRESPLPLARVVDLLSQIAVALDFAHARGFIHRDIKPANILLDDQNKTRITDFGLVKFEDINLTLPGQVMGTPTYMAPEQIVGEDVAAAADIYSLGVVAYEMLGGAAPFTGNMSAVFDGHVRRDPPSLRQMNPNLPLEVELTVGRALAKLPADRFKTAAEFAASLRQVSESDHPHTIAAPPSFATAGHVSAPPQSGVSTGGGAAPVSRPPQAAAGSVPLTAGSVPPTADSVPPQPKKKSNLLPILGGVGLLVALCFCLSFGLFMLASNNENGREGTAVAQATPPAEITPEITADTPDTPLIQPETPETADPEEAADENVITDLEGVRRAVVQIEAQGSFVDPEGGLQLNQAGRGSGFVIDSSGLAVTNNHVVTGAALLRVYVNGETRPRSARVLGVSECYDLAVIQIDGDPLPALSWYEGPIAAGQAVYAAGFPLGQPEYTVTSGTIIEPEADGVTDWAALDYVLAHNAQISPGNSGGPLVDENGRLIGVNYATAAAQNQYFAISRPQALPIIERLQEGEDIYALGINGVAINDGAGLSGIWVSSVKAGSPADQAGLLPGDIITSMQGLLLATDGAMGDYCGILRSHSQDDTLSIEVLRLDTNEVLVGQINGRVLETKSTIADDLDQTMTDEGDSYDDYVNYIDEAEIIKVELPAVWNRTHDGAWIINDETIGLSMAAAGDLDAFYATWTEPGIFLGASRILAERYDENTLLDSFKFDNDCAYENRFEYTDPLYAGYYDLWTGCGGENTTFFVLAAAPEDGAFLILLQVVLVTNADLDALERILDTFVVENSLP